MKTKLKKNEKKRHTLVAKLRLKRKELETRNEIENKKGGKRRNNIPLTLMQNWKKLKT